MSDSDLQQLAVNVENIRQQVRLLNGKVDGLHEVLQDLCTRQDSIFELLKRQVDAEENDSSDWWKSGGQS